MGYFKILIKNGKVFDGFEFINKKDILISDGKIERIEEKINEEVNFVFDATEKIVSPGLVDVHVHMKGIASENFGIEPHMSSFPFGVTAVNNAGSVLGDKALLDSFSVKNRAFVGVDINNNHAIFCKTEEFLKKYGDKAIGIKAYFDKTVSEIYDITPLKEICDYAQSRKLKVMVHCAHSPTTMEEIVRILNKGDILTHIYHCGENNTCLYNDYAAFKLARKKGVILDSGFAGHVHTDFSVLEKAMTDGWFPDTISTDITKLSAFVRGGRYGLTLCMSLCRQFGMKEEDILKAVTSSAAKAVGMSNLGKIEVGSVADIAVLSYGKNPFDFSALAKNGAKGELGYNCHLTLSDGQVVWCDL